MRFQGEFETLKMVSQGGKVRCSTELVEGQLLMYLIRNEEEIIKNQLWLWLHNLCIEIEAYHRCYHRAYQYINPYTILIIKNQEIKLLDLDAQENEMVLLYMQKSIIRESFSKNGNIKRTKIYNDFYSLGRTLQFLLSQGNVIPQINVIESYQLSKIIKKCLEEPSENTYQNLKEIQNQLPRIKKVNKTKKLP